MLCLTAEQKCEVAQCQLREGAAELRTAYRDSEKQLAELKASGKLLAFINMQKRLTKNKQARVHLLRRLST